MQKPSNPVLILILGCMTALTPFSIDMYLPAFDTLAEQFGTTVGRISLSLSSYFVGLAFGQIFYGSVLDRFGRKRPLCMGITVHAIASLVCVFANNPESLMVIRFIQALGGCVAGVASMAMVRDLFTLKESAKVYSLLILILGASPLLAPTMGGLLTVRYGWHSVFVVLMFMALALLAAIIFLLPESHKPDAEVSLNPKVIFTDFIEILKNPRFFKFAVSGAIGFSGLFVYLAGSPVIFLKTYQVGPTVYGWIFAIVASGMIIASQFNVVLLQKFSNEQILMGAMVGQVSVGVLMCVAILLEVLPLPGMVALLFVFFGSFGLTNPNAGALALEPFSRNAGRASSLLGFLQVGLGALASMSIGIFDIQTMLPIALVMGGTSALALVVLLVLSAKPVMPVAANS